MGLVTQLAPVGQARQAAEQLARQIAALPQVCLRGDRASALEGASLEFGAAMANEFRHGLATLTDPGVFEGIVGGVLVFGEPIGSGAVGIIGRVLAFGLVIAGAALVPAPLRATADGPAHQTVAG